MSRKVFVTVHVPLVITVDEGVEMQEVMDNLELTATLDPKGPAQIEDIHPFKQWEVTDSK
jgi:hypothetical protein